MVPAAVFAERLAQVHAGEGELVVSVSVPSLEPHRLMGHHCFSKRRSTGKSHTTVLGDPEAGRAEANGKGGAGKREGGRDVGWVGGGLTLQSPCSHQGLVFPPQGPSLPDSLLEPESSFVPHGQALAQAPEAAWSTRVLTLAELVFLRFPGPTSVSDTTVRDSAPSASLSPPSLPCGPWGHPDPQVAQCLTSHRGGVGQALGTGLC